MIKGMAHAHLGPIWYHSEPSDVPYSPNQFFDWDFFAKDGLWYFLNYYNNFGRLAYDFAAKTQNNISENEVLFS